MKRKRAKRATTKKKTAAGAATKPRSRSHLLYVCGRCGSRYHHAGKCHSCSIHLEPECPKCLSAEGNCVCRLHGAFRK